MTTILFILIWYIVCALIIEGFLLFYSFTNKPRFRDELGDITTEVGYDEDSTGRLLHLTCDDECPDFEIPHVHAPGGTNTGVI